MHPQTHAKCRDQAQRPSAVRSQPSGRLEWSTLELMHNWTSPTTINRKKTPYLQACPDTCKIMRDALSPAGQSLEHQWKGCFPVSRLEALPRLTVQLQFQKTVRPGTAASCLTRTTDMVTRKKADCSILLTRITRLKIVNSEIKSEGRNSYLERYSPKGSCHLDNIQHESHTCSELSLRILLWNASYVQKTIPDRSRSMKGPEKQWQLPSP